ncbi:MAG: hypothetical protein RR772_12540 [Gordonibacter sp.]
MLGKPNTRSACLRWQLLYFVGIGIPLEWRLFFIAALPIVSALLLVAGAGEDVGRGALKRRMYRKLDVRTRQELLDFLAG